MSSEIDESIIMALRDRADGDVHVEDLLTGARRWGTRQRRIRHTLLAAGVSVAVLATLGLVALVPPSGPGPGLPAATPTTSASPTARPSPTAPPEEQRLPALGDRRPPAATTAKPLSAGGRVGADPRLLHLDVADPDLYQLRWWSGPGMESLEVNRAVSWNRSFSEYHVSVASSQSAINAPVASGRAVSPEPSSTEQVSVAGLPATLTLGRGIPEADRYGVLRWQQAPQVWVRVYLYFDSTLGGRQEDDRAAILQVAQWIRFDRVHRCVVNFRLAWTPPGATVDSCSFALTAPDGVSVSSMGLRGGGTVFNVLTSTGEFAAPLNPNTVVAGRQVEVTEGSTRYDYGGGIVEVEPTSISPSDALQVIGGFEPVPGRDPTTWLEPAL